MSKKSSSSGLSECALPAGVQVLERGWLSSNNIVVQGEQGTALIDSGYCTHADQTLALVGSALAGRPLDQLVNTHLHSDHCGGNAALQARYPALHTAIPPGHAHEVRIWDPQALTYTPTGQSCPRFDFNTTLVPGSEILLGDWVWQVHAAPGHDPHSVIFLEPQSRTLVSADALWEHGFGVVFPELDGVQAFDEVAATLDLIERLAPAVVIPGHGAPFVDVATALSVARKRLDGFVTAPDKHRQYAAKVLLKFKLLEAQSMEREALIAWALGSGYLRSLVATAGWGAKDAEQAVHAVVQSLLNSGAATACGTQIHNA